MDFDPACLDFLEHFDRPKSAEAAGAKYVAEVEPTQADGLTSWDFIDALPQRAAQTRGVGWVLLWAAALTVLVMAASMLAQFGYLIAAENALNVAAQAGVMEATLPRSTYQSVTATVRRRLEEQPHFSEHITLTLLQNGKHVIDPLRWRGRRVLDRSIRAGQLRDPRLAREDFRVALPTNHKREGSVPTPQSKAASAHVLSLHEPR